MKTPRAVLLDIEGTTSSIAFVAEVLFPYARARMADFVTAHAAEVAPILADVPEPRLETLLGWMDDDRKETALKALQGRIWADGYAEGTLKGHVYPDTPEALARWQGRSIARYIYSSGSVEAQKLLFGHSVAGDLTALLDGYFDTRTGPKREADSYRSIARSVGLAPADMIFVSDVQAEVDAARAVGMAAVLIDRDGGRGEVANLAEVLP
jgi:enolase-phosphatase E1